MLKTNSLRESMLHGCRWCQANPEKFTIFAESGNIETTGETPSFVYRYQMVMLVMDYAGELDDLTLPLLAWLSENQPQLLLNPERNQDIKFSAVINDDDSADLLFTLPLRERVRITRSSQGTPQAEHLPEPKPRLPSSEGDWSHVFQDVTWGESDG